MRPLLPLLLLGLGAALALGSLEPGPRLAQARAGHSATPLPSGEVLITGGCVVTGCDGGQSDRAELFDPATNSFREIGTMAVARVGHQAVALPSSEVLILGGWAGANATAAAELYDPATGAFRTAGEMLEPRDGFTATRLLDGRVLIAGGYNGRMTRLTSAELFDPADGSFTAVGPLLSPRMSHSASLLHDGRVLIVGGSAGRGQVLASAELYDPATGRFRPVGDLSTPRHKHGAVTLANGQVFIIGGAGAGDWGEQFTTTERFDPETETFRPAATMLEPRFKLPDAVTLLDNGDVLVAGGGQQTERYHPATDRFSPAGTLGLDLAYSTATPLGDGRILIAGGYDTRLRVVDRAWLYHTD